MLRRNGYQQQEFLWFTRLIPKNKLVFKGEIKPARQVLRQLIKQLGRQTNLVVFGTGISFSGISEARVSAMSAFIFCSLLAWKSCCGMRQAFSTYRSRLVSSVTPSPVQTPKGYHRRAAQTLQFSYCGSFVARVSLLLFITHNRMADVLRRSRAIVSL